MPETNSAGVIGSITGIVGFLVGGALSLIGLGKKIERVESGLARSHARHDEQEKKFESFEQAIRTLTAVFTREDGEPRFVTSIVCGKEQVKCHEALFEKFASGAARFGNIEADIKEIKDSQTDNLQIILEEIRKAK